VGRDKFIEYYWTNFPSIRSYNNSFVRNWRVTTKATDKLFKEYGKIKTRLKNKSMKNETICQPHFTTERGKMGEIGFIRLNKNGEKIKIGLTKSKKFKLLESLCSPPNASHSVESLFNTIKSAKDEKCPEYSSFNTGKTRKLDSVKWSIKEIQKIKELQGKLNFEFDERKMFLRLNIA